MTTCRSSIRYQLSTDDDICYVSVYESVSQIQHISILTDQRTPSTYEHDQAILTRLIHSSLLLSIHRIP